MSWLVLAAHILGVLRVIDVILDKEEPADEAAADGSKAKHEDQWFVLPTGGTVTDRCA